MGMSDTEEIKEGDKVNSPKMVERMTNLYETGKWYDCIFKFCKSDGNNEELIYAHRIILATSSPVFESLCFGDLAEKNPILIPDIDPFAFRLMLKFIYTDLIQFPCVDSACDVLYASKKYLLYSLASKAIAYISRHIDECNCIKVYEFSTFLQEERLIKESWRYLCSHLDSVAKHVGKEAFSHDIIRNLANEEELNGGELVLYEICLLWAESECEIRNVEATSDNIRKVLIEMGILNKIRWLTFTDDELNSAIVNNGVLTGDELDFIKTTAGCLSELKDMNSGVFGSSTFEDENKVPDSEYNSDLTIMQKELQCFNVFPSVANMIVKPRGGIPLKRVFCHRYIEGDEKRMKPPITDDLKACTFLVFNKSVKLMGIFLNARIMPIPKCYNCYSRIEAELRTDYTEKVLINITDSNEKNVFEKFFLKTVKYGTSFKIPFNTPVTLDRLKEYKISIKFLNLLNSLENHLFSIRNSISELPCGLCITFKEEIQFPNCNNSIDIQDYGIISGLELCV